jgi:hypothetical protein
MTKIYLSPRMALICIAEFTKNDSYVDELSHGDKNYIYNIVVDANSNEVCPDSRKMDVIQKSNCVSEIGKALTEQHAYLKIETEKMDFKKAEVFRQENKGKVFEVEIS